MIDFPDRKRERFRRRVGATAPRRIFALAFDALALAGCSISTPMPSFIDAEPTGSINAKAPALSSFYDSRDWRVAEPVLAASLRAPGERDPKRWANPETGDHGEFLAVAGPFAREGQSCRAFVARLGDDQDAKTLQGVGCPSDDGEVAVYDVSPWTGL
jgi:surface antigen